MVNCQRVNELRNLARFVLKLGSSFETEVRLGEFGMESGEIEGKLNYFGVKSTELGVKSTGFGVKSGEHEVRFGNFGGISYTV